MRQRAHQGGSISPLMIFTTCDAFANSVAAIAKVTVTRLSLGRSSVIDKFCGVNRRDVIENDRSIFRHAFRCSTNCHLDLRIAFGSRHRGCQGHPYLARLRTWLGSSRHRPRRKWIRSCVKVHDPLNYTAGSRKPFAIPKVRFGASSATTRALTSIHARLTLPLAHGVHPRQRNR